MSRPAMKMLTAFTRCAFSREMLIAPLAMRKSATSDSVTVAIADANRHRTQPLQVTIGIVQAQGDREPAVPLPQLADWRPPSAVSITSSMSRTFRP